MNSHGLGLYLISVNEMFPPCLKVLFQKPRDVSGSHCTWNFKSIAFDLLCCNFVAIINSTKLYFANGQTLLLSNLCKENDLDHLQVLLDSTDNNWNSWMMSIIQWRFTVTISVFWNVVPYSQVASYQRFIGICCLCFISWMWRESQFHLKCWFPLITTHCHIPKDHLNTHNNEHLRCYKKLSIYSKYQTKPLNTLLVQNATWKQVITIWNKNWTGNKWYLWRQSKVVRWVRIYIILRML